MSRPFPAAGSQSALWLAAGCASLSGAALLAHAVGWVRMPFFITFISLPAALALVAHRAWVTRADHRWLGQRIWAGCWIGFLGTLAYDAIRQAIVLSGLYAFNPFRIIVLLGVLITGRPEGDPGAVAAGWTYHFWNGISFGVMYVLVAGRSRVPYAVAWALCLELIMLLTYPHLFGLKAWDPGFFAMSMIGHVAYGLTLGFLAARQDFLPTPWERRKQKGAGL